MNIHQTIRDLYIQKEKVEQIIALLEELRQEFDGVSAENQAKRRRRKFKPPQERRKWSSRHALHVRQERHS